MDFKGLQAPKIRKPTMVFTNKNDCYLSYLKHILIRINTSTLKFNKHLLELTAGLGMKKKMSVYIARHTFG